MAVATIRLNGYEEKLIHKLTIVYQEDRSKIIKRALSEMYENLLDCNEIEKFEKREKKNMVKFYSADEMFSLYKKMKHLPVPSKRKK